MTQIIRANTKHLIAEEITYIMKDLIGKGGYKNIVGLSSSLGKDVIPRISGYFSSQPISDITEVIGDNVYVRPTYAGNALTKVKTTQ